MNDSKGLSRRLGKVFAWWCADDRLDPFRDFLRDVHGFIPKQDHDFRYFGDVYDLVSGSREWQAIFKGQLETFSSCGPCSLVIAGHSDCKHRRRCLPGHPNDVEGVAAEVRRAVHAILKWQQVHELYGYVIPLENDAMKRPVLVTHCKGRTGTNIADSAAEFTKFFSPAHSRERAVTTE